MLNCPKCKTEAFTVEKEEKPLIKWKCGACNYAATGDVTTERMCPVCHTQNGVRMEDSERQYWWCGNCDSVSA